MYFPPNSADKGSHSCGVKTLKIRIREENLNGKYPSPNDTRVVVVVVVVVVVIDVVGGGGGGSGLRPTTKEICCCSWWW
jgi:hypothetical protein